MNAQKLSSVKTYLLVAFVFNILVVIALGFGALFSLVILLIPFIGFFLGLILILPFILSVLVLARVNSMRTAAERGDIAKLKELNSVGWAIIALVFAGIIPGIMLLIANGPINELTPQ
jgi:multisubunit Na+/H+ antiporter MnhB subunit